MFSATSDGSSAVASGPPSEAAFDRLAAELIEQFRRWERHGASWTEEQLDFLAARAFAVQYAGIEAYRRFCDRRGASPRTVRHWSQVPAVPVAAFRTVPLIVGGPSRARLTFRTSGTTAGAATRGCHLVRDPGLYRSSMEATFARKVVPQRGRLAMVSLVPPFDDGSDSSLAWMIDGLLRRFGTADSRSVASAGGIDWTALNRFLAAAIEAAKPACIVGTTLGFADWLDRLESAACPRPLPAGSFAIDTGGTKGRPGVDRSTVCAEVRRYLGLARFVNEFGMTELLSQRYTSPHDPAWLIGPPWLRTRALEPNELAPLPDGEAGILSHYDLANAGSVCAVLTEDIGRVKGDAVQWVGRVPGAPSRGCSLATAELLAAQAEVDAAE